MGAILMVKDESGNLDLLILLSSANVLFSNFPYKSQYAQSKAERKNECKFKLSKNK